MLVVDDAQWADRSSLRFLLYALGAVAEFPLGIILAVRDGDPSPSDDLLRRLRAHPGGVWLAPAMLDASGVAALVTAAGFADPHPDFVHACRRSSGGNPFLLTELLDALSRDNVQPTGEAAIRVGELLPESVLHAVLVRLGRLPATAAALAGAVAVLDRASLPLAAALAGLDTATAEDAADLLVRARLFGPDDPLSFLHPLIGAAVLADLPPRGRARLHRRAAELLEAERADPGHIAAHLLRTLPAGDPWVSTALRGAARDALVNGESGSAVRLLRRAWSEPPPAGPGRDPDRAGPRGSGRRLAARVGPSHPGARPPGRSPPTRRRLPTVGPAAVLQG